MEHFRKLERMYHGAPHNERDDPELAVRDVEATIRIDVHEGQFHPAGAVHGSLYFKALDDATSFAANSLVEDVFLLTTDFHVQLTRPISEGVLRATAEVVNDRPGQYIADGVLRDGDGDQLARGTGTFVRSRIELDADVGYE